MFTSLKSFFGVICGIFQEEMLNNAHGVEVYLVQFDTLNTFPRTSSRTFVVMFSHGVRPRTA